MPELPDVALYLHALEPRVVGRRLERARLFTPFVLRSVEPPIVAASGRKVVALRRLGKRIVFELGPPSDESEAGGEGTRERLFLVVHLMIAGRFQWKEREPTPKDVVSSATTSARPSAAARSGGKIGLASFDFEHGSLLLTEAGTKKRASLHVVLGEARLCELDPGGLEPLECALDAFAAALTRENHTVKRTLTDPHTFSGIGNAYSDEILHRAKLSPFKWTSKLSRDETARLYEATRSTLREWIERLQRQTGEKFPAKVTAFRPEMAVHGKFGAPCPVCGAPVQRIVHAENESNYCARCQTEGKVLADRALSQLLKEDWPRTIEEWEAVRSRS